MFLLNISQEILLDIEEKKLKEELNSLDVNSMTPMEALQVLFDLKSRY